MEKGSESANQALPRCFLYAAKIGMEQKLAMVDSLILATALIHHAELWTQDADFSAIDSVRYFKKGQ